MWKRSTRADNNPYPRSCSTIMLQASTGCVDCEQGKASPSQGRTECEACPAGKHGPTTGLASCLSCPAGQYSTWESSACVACDVNTYSAKPNSTTCTDCPAGTTTSGRTGSDACINSNANAPPSPSAPSPSPSNMVPTSSNITDPKANKSNENLVEIVLLLIGFTSLVSWVV